jgi:hypothetical protein
MSVRRQGYQWEVRDLGQIPPKRLKDLEDPQSIFYSGIGDASLKARLRTKASEYIVIKYFGSTPGIYGTGNNWVPGVEPKYFMTIYSLALVRNRAFRLASPIPE